MTRRPAVWLLAPLGLLGVLSVALVAGALLGSTVACHGLQLARADGILPPCRALAEAEAMLAQGRRLMEERHVHAARTLFEAVVARLPSLAEAHAEHAQAAETLGDYDAALVSYRTALARGGSRDARLQLASLTARVGDVDGAVPLLEESRRWSARTLLAGATSGGATLLTCAGRAWPAVGQIAVQCVPYAWRATRGAYRAVGEAAAQYAFEILLDAGRQDQALALARSRGWVQANLDYCSGPTWELGLSKQTSAFLAMLLQPDRADCLLGVGYELTDDGLPRLARIALQDRARNSADAAVRQRAERYLRARLPAHEVVKVAESLNVTGWRLQNHVQDRDGAIAVYERAIAADPAFSWPYHNLGRLYHVQKQNDSALVWLRRTVSVNPNHVRALRTLGAAAAATERWDEAAAAYQKAIAVDPQDADAYADLGRLLLQLGRQADGMRAIEAAVRIDPGRRERAFVESFTGAGAPAGPSPFGMR